MARTSRRQALAAGTASTAPGATRLALIADKMEELHAAMSGLPEDAWNDDGTGPVINRQWNALYAEASLLPVETPADLVALARVSQNIRDSIGDDTNEPIELIRSKIDAAIIGGMLPTAGAPSDDAAIIAACEALHQFKAERDACPSDNHGGDDLFDRLVAEFDKKLLALVKMPARTVDGWRAQAALVLSEMQKGMEPIAQAFLRQFIGEASARKRSNPDAALFAACDTLRQVVAELDACAGSTDDAAIDALADKEAAAALALASIPAMTHAGLRAQAELLLANMISTQELP